MYKIIGADQKEYGPISAEQLRAWIAEGRANGQTSVWSEGATEWKPLGSLPEFAELLAAGAPASVAAPAYAAPRGLPEDIFTRDYDLDIAGCIGNAWELLKNNFGMLFGGVAIFFLIQIGMGGLGQIPIAGLVFSLASIILSGPLMGGVYYFVLKNIRRQPAEVGDIFAGFRLAFGQLLLGYLVMMILICLSALPGLVIMAFPIYMMIHHHAVEVVPVLVTFVGLFVAMIPAIYFSTGWIFSLPLIIDKQMEFWPAMSASRRMVGKHWWLVFGLVVVCGLIYFAGLLACCVGLFVAMPLIFGAMMYAYESIFSAPASRTA
jgi:hypothetical protein